MSETVKLIIEIPQITYEDLRQGKIYSSLCDAPQGLIEGIRDGIPLDNNSDRAEVQAYFDGQAYGWEQGRKALIDDVKAEFINSYPTNYMNEPELNGAACHFSLNKVLEILENVGKAESEEGGTS